MQSCPKNKNEVQTIKIRPGVMQDETIIIIEPICDCECERDNNLKEDEYCRRNGFLKCGICECKPNYSGQQCECAG